MMSQWLPVVGVVVMNIIMRPCRSLNGNCLVKTSWAVAVGFQCSDFVPLEALVESTVIAPFTVNAPVGAEPVCISKSSQNLAVTPVHPGPPETGGASPPASLPGAASAPASLPDDVEPPVPPLPPVPMLPPAPVDPPADVDPPTPLDPPAADDPPPPVVAPAVAALVLEPPVVLVPVVPEVAPELPPLPPEPGGFRGRSSTE